MCNLFMEKLQFRECKICSGKPGSPTLCESCLENRETIERANNMIADLLVQKGRNMEYTIDDINIYFSKNKIRINEAFNSCTEIPSFLKSQEKIKKIFKKKCE